MSNYSFFTFVSYSIFHIFYLLGRIVKGLDFIFRALPALINLKWLWLGFWLGLGLIRWIYHA